MNILIEREDGSDSVDVLLNDGDTTVYLVRDAATSDLDLVIEALAQRDEARALPV